MSKEIAKHTTVAYINGFELHVGNKIHIKKFRGTYIIQSLTTTTMTISCGTWKVKGRKPETLPLSEFHAFYDEVKGWNTWMKGAIDWEDAEVKLNQAGYTMDYNKAVNQAKTGHF